MRCPVDLASNLTWNIKDVYNSHKFDPIVAGVIRTII